LNTKYPFNLLLIATIFLSTACEEHKDNSQLSDTNISSPKQEREDSIIIENIISNVVHENNISKKVLIKDKKVTPSRLEFTFKNFNKKKTLLDLKNDIYTFTNIAQPIVMINLSSSWCPPCRGEVPHLNSLQKKFKKSLFIITALVHDDIKDNRLKKLIISEKVHFFVATDREENEKFEKMIIKKLGINDNLKLPLMILFNNGKYFTHYEGSMPEEMIESDIKQLLKKIKKRDR
jgi:thiol-disulfide isomerase/thioredoxin